MKRIATLLLAALMLLSAACTAASQTAAPAQTPKATTEPPLDGPGYDCVTEPPRTAEGPDGAAPAQTAPPETRTFTDSVGRTV